MKKHLSIIAGLLFIAIAAHAQQIQLKDSAFVPKKKIFRQYDYENHQTPFPAKKKDKWILGIHGGFANMIGDISTDLGWAAGLRIQKALGHVFSLRLDAQYGHVKGQDITRRLDPDYIDANGAYQKYFGNYKTQYAEAFLEGMATLNNINFYNKQPKVLINVFLGPGVMFSEVRTDKYGANGTKYDFSSVSDYNKLSDANDIRKQIKAIRDGEYETVIGSTEDKANLGNWRVNPALTFGAGLAFRLGKSVDLTFEDRVTFYNSDRLDGTRFTRNYEYSGSSDIINYASVGLNFKIGKRAQPHIWTNPLVAYGDNLNANANDIDTLRRKMKKSANEDKPLDSDGDGIPDSKDAEPFSPKGAKVDQRGVALDTDDDGVKDFADVEPNTPAGAQADAKGREIVLTNTTKGSGGRGTVALAGPTLSSVFFGLNRADVKPEYYPELVKVVEYMRANPNERIIAMGNADVRASEKYNMDLSLRRIKNCVEVLTRIFGIAPERIIEEPRGELDPIVPNLSDKTKKDDGRYLLNRRVDFKVAK